MGIEVVVADVLTPETCDLYRRELPGCLIVHMTVGLPEAMRRAASRKVWLTDHEFRMLHEADAAPRTPTIASKWTYSTCRARPRRWQDSGEHVDDPPRNRRDCPRFG